MGKAAFPIKISEEETVTLKEYKALQKEISNGTPCSIKRVQRHMAEQGLRSVVGKKYNHHANHSSVPEDKANILKRDFRMETINQDSKEARRAIFEYIEGWYNRKRIHSAIDYLTPQ